MFTTGEILIIFIRFVEFIYELFKGIEVNFICIPLIIFINIPFKTFKLLFAFLRRLNKK